MSPPLLVVAGEASGDRVAAGVVRALRAEGPVEVVGMGGAALKAAGAKLECDLRDITGMGLGPVVGRLGGVLRSWSRVLSAARRHRAEAALLVNYTEFNTRLAAALHARGVFVVWYGAPQIWAWRSSRASSLRRSVDRMAVMLPFEEALWRGHGVEARYVGHPAREIAALSRPAARGVMALTDDAPAVALLPGSRPHEVSALLGPMLAALRAVRERRPRVQARVLLAPSLDDRAREGAEGQARASQVETFAVSPEAGAGGVLGAFDVALTASGTAALEAALARAVPVVAYRVGPVTELAARAWLRTPRIALPNILLGREAFPELLQRDACAPTLAAAVLRALDERPRLLSECDEVERSLGTTSTPSREVAAMLAPWLRPSSTP